MEKLGPVCPNSYRYIKCDRPGGTLRVEEVFYGRVGNRDGPLPTGRLSQTYKANQLATNFKFQQKRDQLCICGECTCKKLQKDYSGRQKPPVDLDPTVLAAGGPLLQQ